MFLSDGGYSERQYHNASLRRTARIIAAHLPELMEQTGAQAVAVTGKSGMSLAFATLMLIDFPLIAVRKRGENAHGSPIEGTSGVDVRKYLILDDFVSSGATVRNVVDAIDEMVSCEAHPPVECVGVVTYGRSHSNFVNGVVLGDGRDGRVKIYPLPQEEAEYGRHQEAYGLTGRFRK